MPRGCTVEVFQADAAWKLPGHVGGVRHDQQCHPLLGAGGAEQVDHLLPLLSESFGIKCRAE